MANGNGRELRLGSRIAACALGLALLPALAAAQGPTQPTGRGFVFGGALAGGQLSFGGAERMALAVGPVEGQETLSLWGSSSTYDIRSAWVVRDGQSTAGAERLVPLTSGAAAGFSMHAGYAFNRRVAAVFDVGICAGTGPQGFNEAVGSFFVRFWPSSRVWLEAGPAFSDLGYGYENSVVNSGTLTGSGWSAVVGISVLRKARWSLDVETRYRQIAYDAGFRTSTLAFEIGASRLPLLANAH
jgi:hypothetical protein